VLPRGELRAGLLSCLRQGRSGRKRRSRGQDRRGQIADMTSLHVRPPEVEDRLIPGHWEGDLIKGAFNRSAVGTLVERSSRLVLLAQMEGATAPAALAGFSRVLNGVPEPMRKSLTYDQGKEMSEHKRLIERTGVAVFFADPHSPWQRGANENTNGLLRQYLPSGPMYRATAKRISMRSPGSSIPDRGSYTVSERRCRFMPHCWKRRKRLIPRTINPLLHLVLETAVT
jgi:IS30 family transposase